MFLHMQILLAPPARRVEPVGSSEAKSGLPRRVEKSLSIKAHVGLNSLPLAKRPYRSPKTLVDEGSSGRYAPEPLFSARRPT
jgi:hypothetical protein